MYTFTTSRAGWATTALLGLLLSCQQSTNVVTPDSEDCQLQTELSVSIGNRQTTTYTYNGQGQLIKSVASSGHGSLITYTYTYDAAGNVSTALIQGTAPNFKIDNAGSYEYTGGRLTKITSKSSGTTPGTTVDSYSYDESGRIATYSYSSTDQQYGTESYTFMNGQLTSGAITRGGQSLTVTVDNGRIVSVISPGGSQNRNTYDASGYLTRTDYLDKAGNLLSYTLYEYSKTAYKKAHMLYKVIPTINLYGNKEFPESRVAIYNADGTLKAETRYQYEINSKGYITGLSYEQTQAGVGGKNTNSTTYTYSNCQWFNTFD